jgi:septal ring factor EnvC (AmiA/AmiB activator)
VLAGYGELNPTGYRERGIRLSVAPNARVVAPAAGRISYAGRYRSFGNIVIIEHGGGWATLVTGLETLGVEAGARVSQGAALGNAGGESPEIMIELRRNGRLMDIAALLG